jgi:CRISPR-associated protein Csb2
MDNGTGVLGWRWRVEGTGPPITSTLPFAEAVRAAVMQVARKQGTENLPDAFHHSTSDAHTHAYWLPEDENDDSLIDHVLVYADSGIAAEVVAALASVKTVAIGHQSLKLKPQWMGRECPSRLVGPSLRWSGVTPYVTPLWRLTKTGKERADFTPDAQIAGEFKILGLPAAQLSWSPARWSDAGVLSAAQFDGQRQNGRGPNRDAVAAILEVEFAEPVQGPLAFGYGAHFGLGLLKAMDGL